MTNGEEELSRCEVDANISNANLSVFNGQLKTVKKSEQRPVYI